MGAPKRGRTKPEQIAAALRAMAIATKAAKSKVPPTEPKQPKKEPE
jgi:hypothetical protein